MLTISTNRADLLRVVRLAAHVTARNISQPILHGILLTCRDQQLHMVATDLDHWLSMRVAADADGDGGIILPADRLKQVLTTLDGDIRLEVQQNAATIRAGRARITLTGTPADMYPTPPQWPDTPAAEISTWALNNAVDDVGFAVSNDDSQPVLSGMLIHRKHDGLWAVGTDTHRLACCSLPIPDDDSHAPDMIVRPLMLRHVLSAFTESDAVRLRWSDNHLFMADDSGTWAAVRLIDGSYPDYQRVFVSPSFLVTVDRHDLIRALQRIATVAPSGGEKARLRNVCLSVHPDCVDVSAMSPDIGEGNDTIDAMVSGDSVADDWRMDIGANAIYLLDALDHIDSDTVRIGLIDGVHPITIMPLPDDGSALHVVMPMRLD